MSFPPRIRGREREGRDSPLGLRLAQAAWLARHLRRPRSRASLLEFQKLMLRRIVRHAYGSTPFYRRLWDRHGLSPADIAAAADIMRLPLTSKTSMREVPAEDLVSIPFCGSRLRAGRTTGSTGTPFLVLRTGWEDFVQHLFNYRCMREYGLKSGDRVLRVRSIGGWKKPLLWRAAEAVGLFRQDRLPTTLAPRELADALLRLRPDILTSYTCVLGRAAECLIADGSPPLGCRLVVIGAELASPRIRDDIKRALSGRVLDTYSTQEVGLAAWECPTTGYYHVGEDNVILEVLRRDGAPCREGEEGEVVVTSLQALAMPFIRFRLEDVAVRGPAPCPCGAPYATIAGIKGRLQDYFLLPDGREVYPWYIVSLFPDRAPWIRQYDIEQDESGPIRMRVVPCRIPTESEIENCRGLFRSALGPNVEVRIEIVKDIPPGPGGKYYYQRSRRRSVYRPEDLPFKAKGSGRSPGA